MKLNVLGGSYPQKYPDVSTQRRINWYPVVFSQGENAKNQLAAYPTAGLTLFYNITGRYSRGAFTARTTNFTRTFCVVDQTLWEINANQTVTNRGTLTNIPHGSSKVWLKCNGDQQVFIGHYGAGYVFNMTTNVLSQVVDTNYPGSITFADYIDGYLFVVSGGTVFFSVANDFTNWTGPNGQQTYHPTFRAAPTIATVAFRDKIFNFSSETIEPYYEDGTTSVWSRFPASIINLGLANANLINISEQGIYFISRSERGEYHASTLSNEWGTVASLSEQEPSIQWKLNQNPTALREAWSYIQQTKDGGSLWKIFIPALHTTLCYNLTTNMWHEQQSMNPSINSDGTYSADMFRGITYFSFNGLNCYQDFYSGAILTEDFNNQTENGTFIKRTNISQQYTEDYSIIGASTFELDATKGPGTNTTLNPSLMLYTSVNGGRTYTQPRTMLLGNEGDYLYRARVQKLGSGRIWVVKLEQTDPIDLMLQAAWVKGSVGNY